MRGGIIAQMRKHRLRPGQAQMLDALEAGDQNVMDMEVQESPAGAVKDQPILDVRITRPWLADDPSATNFLHAFTEGVRVTLIDKEVEIRLAGQCLGKMKITLPMRKAHSLLAKGTEKHCAYW